MAASGQGGGAADLFAKKSGRQSNFKVVVRVRPAVERELRSRCQMCVDVESDQSIVMQKTPDVAMSVEQRPSTAAQQSYAFGYDHVFNRGTTQEELYRAAVRPVVSSVLQGYNGSIIAYGQTGTGKTHTIEGEIEGDGRGIIPRAAMDVFSHIQDKADAASQWLVRVSYLQIYAEKIYDLLSDTVKEKDSLRIRETGDGGVYVEDLSEHVVRTPQEVYALMQRGKASRTTNSTRMNRESSRSHAVFTIVVEHGTTAPEDTDARTVTIGKLHLVDLAGSERYDVTDNSKHQKETRDINTSLSAFGKVILSLTSRSRAHIPYRDSRLTRILQDSLGGNCMTTMITTISPASVSYFESLSSLKFANRAKSVKNVATVNEDKSEKAMLSAYQAEIRKLKEMLKSQEQVQAPAGSEELERLQHMNKQANLEKSYIVTELAKQQREVQQALEEKDQLQQKIQDLEAQCMNGGTTIEDSVEFLQALESERERLKVEQEAVLQKQEEEREQLASERKRLEEEKLRFERQRKQFAMKTAGLAAKGVAKFKAGLHRPNGASLAEPTPPRAGGPAAGRYARASGARRDSDGAMPAKAPLRRNSALQSQAGQAWGDSSDSDESDDAFVGRRAAATTAPPGAQMTPAALGQARAGHSPAQRPRTAASRPCRGSQSSAEFGQDDMWGPVRAYGASRPQTAPQRRPVDDTARGGTDPQKEALDAYVRALTDPSTGIPRTTKRYRLTSYKNCFSGTEGANWFMEHMEGVLSVPQARDVGQNLLDLGIIANVRNEKVFEVSDSSFFQFRPRPGIAATQPPPSARRPSTASSLRRQSSYNGSRRLSRTSSHLSLASAVSGRTSSSSMASFTTAHSADSQTESDDLFDSEGNSTSPLHLAAGKGDLTGLKNLVDEYGVEHVDAAGRTALMYAVIGNKGKSVRFLLKSGAEVNANDDNGNTALLWAACRGCRDALKILLREGADIEAADSEGRTALHWATKLKRTDCLDLVLKMSFKTLVNRQDEESLGALHWAVMCHHPAHVELLLRNQANSLVTDTEGRTPLHYAVSRNAMDCMKVLLEASPESVNIADTTGRTALHMACGEGSMDAVTLLLSVPGIDVNSTDQRLTTALHWAAVCNRPEVCRMLLQRGARLMSRDAGGMTPLHYSMEKGFHECASVMQRFGGGQRSALGSGGPDTGLRHPLDMMTQSVPKQVPSRRSMLPTRPATGGPRPATGGRRPLSSRARP